MTEPFCETTVLCHRNVTLWHFGSLIVEFNRFWGMFCLQHALSDKACVKAFDPKTTCLQECLITTFQEAYFVSESFEEAKEKMR